MKRLSGVPVWRGWFVMIVLLLVGCSGPSAPAQGTLPAATTAGSGATSPAATANTAPTTAATAGAEQPGAALTFWSTEIQPERVAKTQQILDKFTQATGISVELVPTEEDALPELITAATAAGTLPDVIFHPLDFSIGWYQNGILDAAAATRAIESLGKETFSTGALGLVQVDEGYATVPSDGWGQLLVYRKDLFAAAGLESPTTYATIMAAAQALHKPEQNFYGITAASKAGEVFTQQTFEHIALANNCQMVDQSGAVTINSPACVEAIKTYTDLLKQYGPPGEADATTTRATYFAGQAAMVIWSPFILDEMAGLRDNALPTCPECTADPMFLAKNSGFVPAFAGPQGQPAQYGQISAMGITTQADVDTAITFLTFWFNEGYLDWLAVAPEGKLPMRAGTKENPNQWREGWSQLETGVDRKAKLSDIYGSEVLNVLIDGTNRFQRWGFSQGQGALVGAVYESLPVPAQIRDVLDEVTTPNDAAVELQTAIEDLQK